MKAMLKNVLTARRVTNWSAECEMGSLERMLRQKEREREKAGKVCRRKRTRKIVGEIHTGFGLRWAVNL